MLLDNQMVVSDKQAITASAISTNIIDLGSTGRRIGAGEPMALVIKADVAADHTTGDETYQVDIYTDDDVAFGSPTTLRSLVISYADLALNKRVIMPLSPDFAMERYLAAHLTTGGTTPTLTATVELVPMNSLSTRHDFGNNYTFTHP